MLRSLGRVGGREVEGDWPGNRERGSVRLMEYLPLYLKAVLALVALVLALPATSLDLDPARD